jgi:hypothetical protein
MHVRVTPGDSGVHSNCVVVTLWTTNDAHFASETTIIASTMATTKPPSDTSIRYQRLLECIPKALEKCRQEIDIENTIRMCYGPGDGNEVLCSMLEGVLNQFHTAVTMDVTQFLEDEKVHEKLLKLEAVIRKVDRDISMKRKAATDDKKLTLNALKSAKLPDDVSPQDLLQYESYQRIFEEKQRVQGEIEFLKREIEHLDAEKENFMDVVNGQVQEMHTVKAELEQSADLCSLVK